MKSKKILLSLIALFLIPSLLSNSPAPDPRPNYYYDDFSFTLSEVNKEENSYIYRISYNNSGDNYVYIEQYNFTYCNYIFQDIIIEPYSIGTLFISSTSEKTIDDFYYNAYEKEDSIKATIIDYSLTLISNEKNALGFYQYDLNINLKKYDPSYYYYFILDTKYLDDEQTILYRDCHSPYIYTTEKIDIELFKIQDITLLQGMDKTNKGYVLIYTMVIATIISSIIFVILLITGIIVLIVVLSKKGKNKPKKDNIEQNK